MATTGRGFLRGILRAALTAANTTTELVENGILFSEGDSVEPDEKPRGVWSLVPDSREPGQEWSEDNEDESGAVEATVMATCTVAADESVYEIGDALIDAIERALESFVPSPDSFTHPETGTRIHLKQTRPITIGLTTTAHVPEGTPAIAEVVLYPVIQYRRVAP